MIGIFIALLIVMIVVIKFCKKTLKIVLSVIIILITMYSIVVSVDINMTNSLKKPKFAILKEMSEYEDCSKQIYRGIGYRIEVKMIENQRIISCTMYMLDRVVAASIT